MKKLIAILLVAAALSAGSFLSSAQAALQAVGPISAATGYPIWYADTNNLALDLCIDNSGFCLAIPPNPALPPSVPGNWDPAGEAFWWMAEAFLPDPSIDAILVLAMEAAFVGPIINGGQLAFARIRIRMTPAQTGNFVVTHPFGTITLAGVAGVTQTVTQDVGIGLPVGAPGNLLGELALADDPLQAGTVNADGRSIGPFLRPSATPGGAPLPNIVVPPGVNFAGGTYIANPNVPTAVTGGPNGNAFTITGPGVVNGSTTQFVVQGKVSGCGPLNLAPVAVNDRLLAAPGVATVLNLTANDTDDSRVDPSTIVITVAPANGTAVVNPDGTVTYTANAAFTGDTFSYTVQDFCGVTSNVAVVSLGSSLTNRAEYRPRTGKWTIMGDSAINPGTDVITIRRGSVTGPIIGTANVGLDGKFKFSGKSRVSPGATPRLVHLSSPGGVNLTVPLLLR
jgi:hypothetical protein